MVERFVIPYPKTPAGKSRWSKVYSDNAYYAGKHWSDRREDAAFWHNLTRACMHNAGIRKRPFEKPVVVTFYWNDRLDVDNHSVMGKMIVDGMKGRLLTNDSRRWVKGVAHYFHDCDHILVEVKEI